VGVEKEIEKEKKERENKILFKKKVWYLKGRIVWSSLVDLIQPTFLQPFHSSYIFINKHFNQYKILPPKFWEGFQKNINRLSPNYLGHIYCSLWLNGNKFWGN
jgi:hypothetical protein